MEFASKRLLTSGVGAGSCRALPTSALTHSPLYRPPAFRRDERLRASGTGTWLSALMHTLACLGP